MIEDTISKIEEALKTNTNISEDTKKDLLNLVANLKSEVTDLSKTNKEDAQSIANFAKSTTDEATRENKKPQLLKQSLEGLTASVEEIESEHPKVASAVNSLIEILSNLGI